MTIILGVDPGSRFTGYGVVRVAGVKVSHISHGVIRCGSGELGSRLKLIFRGLKEIASEFSPQEFAIEKTFMAKNANSALILGQARGAAICAAAEFDLGIFEYAPTEIKKAIVGRGRADKAQVQHMIKVLLNLTAVPATDAADALGVAITHAHLRQSRAHLAAAKQTGGWG